MKNGLKTSKCCEEVFFRNEAGCRSGCSTLVGRMKESIKPVTRWKVQKMHRLYHCPAWHEIRREIPEAFRKCEKKEQNFKERMEVTKRYRRALKVKANGTGVTSGWKSGSLRNTKSWDMPAEGFKGHVATNGSLQGTAGKWGACGWSVVQLDCDKNWCFLHGMYGSMAAELEVQRTMKRVELTAFLCFLRKVCGPIKVHVVREVWKRQ